MSQPPLSDGRPKGAVASAAKAADLACPFQISRSFAATRKTAAGVLLTRIMALPLSMFRLRNQKMMRCPFGALVIALDV